MKNGIDEPKELSGVGGKILGHLHTNKISFDGETTTCEFFMCENWESGIGLLGHSGFFDKYATFFNTPDQYYEIYKKKESA
ncbi:MAG TPA: hypothetical protein PLQ76_02780 [bacterium]|nr:hypothetical protein [bacterium]